MTEKEINAYRFGTGEEPTDEMLEYIMKEVATEARRSNAEAHEKMMQNIQRIVRESQPIWDNLIKEINGCNRAKT